MTILAVETATREVAVAVAASEGAPQVLASLRLGGGPRHCELLAPAINWVLARLELGMGQVTALAVDVGPGLFSGVRVGVATVKAMALALGLPVAGCSSLDLLAWRARHMDRPLAAVLDARKGQVYWARYQPGARVRECEPQVGDPHELSADLNAASAKLAPGDAPYLVLGDGGLRYSQVLVGHELWGLEESTPSVDGLAHLAREALDSGQVTSAAHLSVHYLRPPDAKVGWEPWKPGPPESGQ